MRKMSPTLGTQFMNKSPIMKDSLRAPTRLETKLVDF